MPEMTLEENVIAFLAKETSSRAESILLSTRLGTDLGVDGDDGNELIAHFAAQFGVDLTFFEPSQFFGPEGSFLPFAFLWPSLRKARAKHHDLTVQELVHIARSRRWPQTLQETQRR